MFLEPQIYKILFKLQNNFCCHFERSREILFNTLTIECFRLTWISPFRSISFHSSRNDEGKGVSNLKSSWVIGWMKHNL